LIYAVTRENPSTVNTVVELVLEGKLKSLPPDLLGAVVRRIAQILDIPASEIGVEYAALGSVILRLKLPKEAADKLQRLFEEGDEQVKELGLKSVRPLSQAQLNAALLEAMLTGQEAKKPLVAAAPVIDPEDK